MAVNTELCSKDRAVLPQSIWNGRPIRMKRQDEVARVKSDKVSVDGGHAGSDDDGHLRSTRQVDPHHPSHSLLRYDDSADPVKALKTRHSRDDMRFALFFSLSISLLPQIQPHCISPCHGCLHNAPRWFRLFDDFLEALRDVRLGIHHDCDRYCDTICNHRVWLCKA